MHRRRSSSSPALPRPLPLVAAISAAFAISAHAQVTTVSGADSTPKTLSNGQSLSVTASGALQVGAADTAVTANTGTTSATNAGSIAQTGTGRAIDSNAGTPIFTLTNLAGASITALGSEVVRINRAAGTYTLINDGTIWMQGTTPGGSRAIKADANFSTAGAVRITNGSDGNRAALIRSDANDAIRIGSNTTLVNWGTIESRGVVNTSCPDYQAASVGCGPDVSAADGVAIENGRAYATVLNHGVITGPRHGVDGGDPVAATADANLVAIDRLVVNTADAAGVSFDVVRGGITTATNVRIANPAVVNYADGVITGKNGSGVGIDGHAVVINYGTITGNYAGAGNVYNHAGGTSGTPTGPAGLTVANGDGDGVDIDGIAYVENWGRIAGTGAGGLDSGGNPNGADGIAAGGGTFINHVGATIYGQGKGVLVDDGAGGTAIAARRGTADATGGVAVIVNDGTITAERGAAIGLVGNFDDTLTNGSTGVITGGAQATRVDENGGSTPGAAVQMGDGNDTLTNFGRIEGRNGRAIDLGAGDDTARLFAGGTTGIVIGTVDGGAGMDTLETGGTQRFAAGQVLNFERFVVRNGATTFEYALGAVDAVQVDAGAALRINGGFSTAGALTVNGLLAAPAGPTLRTVDVGSYSQGAAGVLEARVGAAGASDRIAARGMASLANGATVRVVPVAYVADGASYLLVSSATGLAATAAQLQLQQPGGTLVSYRLATVGNELRLVAQRSATLQAVAPVGLGSLGAALDALGKSGSSADGLLAGIDAQTPTGAAASVAELAQERARAGQHAAQLMSSAMLDALGGRMDAARGNTVAQGAMTGLAAGDATGRRTWVQGLGAWAEQKARAGANGFDADAWGVAAGLEADRGAQDVAGLSVGLHRASADGTGAGDGDNVRVRASSLGGYWSRTLPGMTLDGSVLAGRNRYDARRTVNAGGTVQNLTGAYDGWQLGGQVEAGFPFMLRPDVSGRWLAGARAGYLATDGYTEQGGSAALQVRSAHATSLQSMLGAELTMATGTASALQLRARWLHEFGDAADLDASFVAGGPSFTTTGVKPNRDALQLGVGLRHEAARGVTLSLRYDAELKQSYIGHQLSARAIWSF